MRSTPMTHCQTRAIVSSYYPWPAFSHEDVAASAAAAVALVLEAFAPRCELLSAVFSCLS